jgi:hypothetical protein
MTKSGASKSSRPAGRGPRCAGRRWSWAGCWRDPDVAADDAAPTDDGLAAEDGCVGVDDDVVLDRRMALVRRQRLGDRERAQGHSLVELHVVADLGRFADHDAGAVVDDDRMAERRAGVDVDAGPLVRPLGQHARQDGHAQLVEPMGDAMDGDGQEAGVGQDDLVDALGRGVAALDCRGVDHQLAVDLGQRAEEGGRDLGRGRRSRPRAAAAAPEARPPKRRARRELRRSWRMSARRPAGRACPAGPDPGGDPRLCHTRAASPSARTP